MRLRDQLIGAAAIVVVTYIGVVRIAEAKCDEAVGSMGVRLDEGSPQDLDAFRALTTRLDEIGEGELSGRLEELRKRGELWAAPALGPERWAAYVESLGLVRRIYIRRVALLSPRAHLYPGPAPAVPNEHQEAFAFLSLSGAMRHELAHRDGAVEEEDAYRQEKDWYEHVAGSSYVASLEGEKRAAWDWAIEAALLSVTRAAQKAGATI